MADKRSPTDATSQIIVLAADAPRFDAYQAAFQKASLPATVTLDPDEAEAAVAGIHPEVVVLDRGLPRLVLFRLYGLVREGPADSPVQVVFVGQEGETGPEDHYLPGEPSPAAVVIEVIGLVDRLSLVDPSDPGASAPAAADPVAPVAAREATAQQASTAVQGGAVADRVAAKAVTASAAPGVPEGASASEVEDAASDSTALEPIPARARPPGRRLDVILIRVGLVLLILGALLILLRSDANPPTLEAPSTAPATPTRPPTASPKPAALFEVEGYGVVSIGQR